MSNIHNWRKEFVTETLILFLCIKGRINFLQLGRFGEHKEQRYRQQFEKPFDFLTFNNELTLSHGSGRYAIAFDPSYISKAGKHTPGIGYFWSGCANRTKWGLEIGGLAAIDIDNHTAFHLEAIQTLADKEQSLSGWYADVISKRKTQLLELSNNLVADAWFAKRSFVDRVIKTDMHLISRLRDDADLLHLHQGKPTGKRGRPKKYDGKVDNTNVDINRFTLISKEDQATIHSAIVYSKSLKRNIKVVHFIVMRMENKTINCIFQLIQT
ncbi:hypothetical protein [Plebeiibacterium sediminum]|uniref:Transposase n=1 Tax=Plebeiibacterium sediminum TaxID=2992112 RepID=A0AAE3M8P5_9BACT|nr:hypothetical protein [Plebeiobacterium sediminum]MCW3789214.1 transposase [Plebeiobacterium sediminum]